MTAFDHRTVLEVAGMTCDACERHVRRALEGASASYVSADWRRGVARFRWQESVSEAALRHAVAAAGYRPGTLRVEEPGHQIPAGDAGVDYDLLVLGAGSAAFAAAIKGTEAGYRVALVEAGTLGGTCVNVGCVPSKALLRAGEAYWAAGHHPFAGITTAAGPVDLAALVAQKDDLVAALRQEKYADLVEAYGFEVIPGRARFVDPDTVAIDGRHLRAGAVLVATGASPAVPPIPGLAEAGYLTSTTALDLKELPRRLAVIGANAIGLELGTSSSSTSDPRSPSSTSLPASPPSRSPRSPRRSPWCSRSGAPSSTPPPASWRSSGRVSPGGFGRRSPAPRWSSRPTRSSSPPAAVPTRPTSASRRRASRSTPAEPWWWTSSCAPRTPGCGPPGT